MRDTLSEEQGLARTYELTAASILKFTALNGIIASAAVVVGGLVLSLHPLLILAACTTGLSITLAAFVAAVLLTVKPGLNRPNVEVEQ